MPPPIRRPVREPRAWGSVMVLGSLLTLVTLTVLFPGATVGMLIASGMVRDGPVPALAAAALDAQDVMLLLRTLRAAILIGILATALAWPVAWALSARRAGWAGLMLAPMLLPSYLAYSGWGLLRSPGTWTGDMLAAAPPPSWSDEPGYWPLVAGRTLAILGLALWAWPLGAIILRAGISRIDPSSLEALRLEAGAGWRRRLCVMEMLRGPILGSIGAVSLVMLGSAVPLHLAQIQTWAVRLWLLLDQTALDARWTVWIGAWPLVVVVAGVVMVWPRIAGLADADQAAPPRPDHPRGPIATDLTAALVWACSAVAPALLFAWFIPGWTALATFWRVHHAPFLTSLTLGGILAAIGAALATAAWFGASAGDRGRRIVAGCGAIMLAAGLLPGVLVGSATAAAWNAWPATRWMADSPLIVVLGHIARFGFFPILVGAWLARSEGRDERGRRRLDGADGLGGWARACLAGGIVAILATGIATGVLGFHEIESAVILQPPGMEGFPRQMLAFLHFARTQELCAGAVLTIGVGIVAGGSAVACGRLAGVRWSR